MKSSVDAMVQKTEMELGISTKFDLKEILQLQVYLAKTSIIPGLPTGIFVAKGRIASDTLDKSFEKIRRNAFDYADPLKKMTGQVYGYKGTIDDAVKQSKKVDAILKELSSNPSDPLTKKLKDFYSVEPKKEARLNYLKKK